MQALEHDKNPLGVFGIEAHAVVGHGKPPQVPVSAGANFDAGRLLAAKTARTRYAPAVAVEFGRKVLYSTDRPTFAELEEDLKSRKGK